MKTVHWSQECAVLHRRTWESIYKNCEIEGIDEKELLTMVMKDLNGHPNPKQVAEFIKLVTI